MHRILAVFTLTLSLCALGLIPLRAQQGGSISGTVVDQTAKAIPGASVDVRNEITGESHPATADENGKFVVTDLAPGTYSVRVSAPGFALTTRSGGQITAGMICSRLLSAKF